MHNTITRLRIGGINERDREGLAMTSESEQVVGPQHVDSAVGTGRWTPRPAPAKGRVLVIEDDSLVRDAMEPLLEDEGYEVWSADNGQEALRWLQTDSLPDIIVLDLKMPVTDGWQFRVIQKGDARLSRIPVLALSADRSAQATSISAQAFLRKPVDATTLLAVLSKPFKIDRAEQLMAKGMRERSNG
jgi:CheY-like chemotaxis protein